MGAGMMAAGGASAGQAVAGTGASAVELQAVLERFAGFGVKASGGAGDNAFLIPTS